jgi:alpha-tubulin suppressor-like RCC1 family protein
MIEAMKGCRLFFVASMVGGAVSLLLTSSLARADALVPHLSTGGYHTCVAKNNGTLWCWGFNGGGQLGDGTNVDKYYPWQITSVGSSVVEVAAGFDHTCARMKDGTLWCWGLNDAGEVGDGTATNRNVPVQVTALGNTVAGVSAGDEHTCARKTDGTLWCWGYNGFGQLGDGTATSSATPVQVAASGFFIEVSAGGYHTCARKSDSTLWCWGDNDVGMLGDGTTTNRSTPVQVTGLESPAAEVSAGEDHTCARLTDGTLWCWGWNYHGQLGDGSHTDSSTPVQVDRLGTVVTQISTGRDFTCARETDDSLWCWGYDDYGELGNGTTLEKTIPTAVSALGQSVNEVSAGQYFACASDDSGSTWCWGSNLTGQLGTGTLNDSAVPVQALNFTNPLVPAGDLSTEIALAGVLLLSGVGLLGGRARRRRALGSPFSGVDG